MRVERVEQWAKAGGTVAACALLGAIAGHSIGHTLLGVLGGVALGMGVNHKRQCPVCMEHMRAMEARLA